MSRAVADVLLGKYKAKRMNQAEIAKATGIPAVTLRKKIAGESPIAVHELVAISAAIGVAPQDVLDEALELMSEAPDNVVSMQKHPRNMSGEEIDAYTGARAAHAFEDEADAPEE